MASRSIADARVARSRGPAQELTLAPFVATTILAIPFAWLAGLDFMFFHAAGLYVLFNYRFKTPAGAFGQLIGAVVFVYVISVLFNSFFTVEPIDRYIAWANNISILLVSLIFFRVGKDTGRSMVLAENPDNIRKAIREKLFIVALIYFGVSFAFRFNPVTSISDAVRIPTLFGLVTPPLPGLLGQYRSVIVSAADWFAGGLEVRTYLFAPFATGSSLMGMLLGGLWWAFRKNMTASKFLIGFVVIALSCYVLTSARSGLLSLAVAILVGMMALTTPKLRVLLFTLSLIALPFLLSTATPLLESVYDAREGSNDARLHTYQYTLETVFNANPLLGLGVRPDLDQFFIVVGSHQSFLAALTRGGLLAFSLFAIAFLVVLPLNMASLMSERSSRVLKDKGVWQIAVATMCLTAAAIAWMLFQDIDAYPIVSVFVFLTIGLMRGLLSGSRSIAPKQQTQRLTAMSPRGRTKVLTGTAPKLRSSILG